MRIGVDIGGTFTDITGIDEDGSSYVAKIPSTPEDQSVALTDGINRLLEQAGVPAGTVDYLGHGTTVATNTLLELDGVPTALVVTEGFRDLLEIGRQRRPSLYDLFAQKPRVLVPRRLVFEVPERLDASGAVARELTDESIGRLVDDLEAAGVASVAISLLHSYRDSAHEERIAAAIARRLPELYVSRSSAVAPEFREYERTSTTVINAYIGPKMSRYVSRLADRTRQLGVPVDPKIIQSNGGLVSPDTVASRPVTTLLSGPSAGVIGAAWSAQLSGYDDIVTFDMGGTSTDVCLVRGGRALTMGERSIEGYTVRVPSVSVHTVGAGGGSIAAADDAGALQVGPRSAGAVPGPAAYGRGGSQPTVTDANVVLHRQMPSRRAQLQLDTAAAERAVEQVAGGLGNSTQDAALGIVRIADSHMSRAVRQVSVESGEDPRDFALIAYGGSGPMHAVQVAASVGIGTVLVPPRPGTLCALGLLVSDLQTEFLRSVLAPLTSEGLPTVVAAMDGLTDQARVWFEEEQVPSSDRELDYSMALRYPRQNFELEVDLDQPLDEQSLPDVIRNFHLVHDKTYGFAHHDADVEAVNVRVRARQRIEEPKPQTLLPAESDLDSRALVATRPVTFGESVDGSRVGRETRVYDRSLLCDGDLLSGPAIVEQMDSTVLLPPGCQARVDVFGMLIVEVLTHA